MKNFKNSKAVKIATGLLGLALSAMMIAPAMASAMDTMMTTSSSSCSYVFTATLKMGSSNQEVWNLQKVLNMSADTQVAASGAGSPGMETKHFGKATKAAVIKWQNMHAADVLTPAGLTTGTGLIGAMSRAKLNMMCGGSMTTTTTTGSMSKVPGCTSTVGFSATSGVACNSMTTSAITVPGCTSAVGFSPLTGMSCSAGTTSTGSSMGVTAGAVTATMLPNTGSTIIAGAAQVPVLNFRLANGTAADVTVSGMKFTKTGVLSDSNISNAYISKGNAVVAQYTGLTAGVVSFSGNLLTIPAGQSLDLSFRVDVSSGAAVGNSVAFAIVNATDVTLSAGTISGMFPMIGGQNFISTVNNPSLAKISTLVYQGVSSQVDSGTVGFRAGALSFTVDNSPVKIQSMAFTVSGSVNFSTDLQNMVLKIDGVSVATAAGVSADGKARFDLGTTTYQVGTGSHQVEVYTDVIGTANRNFKFEILRPYDVLIWDTAYNTNISFGTPSGAATQVGVRAGTGTASLSSDTPTGTVPRGGSHLTLAKFTVRASGEALRIKWLPFKITQGGSSTTWATVGNTDLDIRNIAIYADDGTQIGTTINTPSSCAYGTPILSATTYSCSFGSPTSIINYLIPANTTRVLSLVVDVQAAGTVTSLKGSIVAPAGTFAGSNAEGQISFVSTSVPGGEIAGSNLSVSASPFQGTQNSAFSAQTFVGGANVAKVGSFALSASAGEAINVTSVTLNTSAAVNLGALGINVQNLMVKVGTAVWNYNVPTVSPSTSYTFSSLNVPTMIPAGGTVNVDVYADVLTGSAAGPYTAPISLIGAVGIGAQTNTNQSLKNTSGVLISSGVPVAGQNITIAGVGSLTATVNSSLPPSQQIVLGSTGVSLGQFRFTAGNNEDMKIVDLTLTSSSTSSASPATFKNIVLKAADGTVLGTGTSLAGALGVYKTSFHFATPLTILKNLTNEYKVVGDVATFTESPLSQNTLFSWQIGTSSDINAFGNSSNQSVVVATTSPLIANAQTVFRTKLTATMASLGAQSSRARTAVDDIANLTLTVDTAYGAEFKAVTFKLSGAAVPVAGNVTLSLVDTDTGIVAASTTVAVATATSTGVVISMPSAYLITQGLQKTYKVRVDSSGFANAVSSSDSFSIQIANAPDLVWQTQGLVETLGLETKVIPINSTISYE